MTEFKPGDRVKVEYETEFVRSSSSQPSEAVVRHPSANDFGIALVPFSVLSKLPDPEPEWRKGDVVRFRDYEDAPVHVALRTGGLWQCSCGADFRDEEHAYRWAAGFVEVLHREDQP